MIILLVGRHSFHDQLLYPLPVEIGEVTEQCDVDFWCGLSRYREDSSVAVIL